jgi:predicted transcriptional regulator
MLSVLQIFFGNFKRRSAVTIDATEALHLAKTRCDPRVERERIQLLWIADARRGLADIAAGRTQEADDAIGMIQQRRALAACVVSSADSGAGTKNGASK